MTISTKYNIGDIITIAGVEYEIMSMHIYESEETHSERYYLGRHRWFTIESEVER